MEDIEYLEEYEDLVLPALNSAAAEAAAGPSASFETNAKQLNQKNNEADDSSSSLDQDIFNCLFDDNSDDEDYNNQNSECESALKQKTISHETFVTLEDKLKKIGNTVIEKVEISLQDPPRKQNITPKTVNKITSTTKPKGFMSKTSGTTVPLSGIKQEIPANKTKSVATVRPTVNSKLNLSLPNKANISQRPALSSSSSSSSVSSAIKRQNPSTSAALKSYRTIRFPVAPPKLSFSSASSNLPIKNLFNKSPAASTVTTIRSSTVPKKHIKRPATIVRPEKIISKDPANDPLDLDDISEANSNDSSFSDISGETYNTISDLGDDESNDNFYSGEDDFYADDDEANDISSTQIIELSNDSSGTPLKLEDIRAPTPSPVISDDSNISGNSFGFIINKKQTIKPYSHSAIIESVLRKGEKPKLLALLKTFNLLEDPAESIKEDIVIDITTSRENLVENTDNHQQQQQVTSSKQILDSTITLIDPVDSTVNNKSLTLNTPKTEQTLSKSKETNKKRKKKSLTNMDASNDYSTDSDLSAVEELLEESYAEAMKTVTNVPITNRDIGAEIMISGEECNKIIEENKQKLPKADVVIYYDDESKEIKENKTESIAENVKEHNKSTAKEEDQLTKESQKLESVTRDQTITSEPLETVEQNADNKNDTVPQAISIECQEIVEILEVPKSSKTDCPGNRKKKRFRNLISPEPTEKSSDETKSVDDLTDFKGFEEEAKQNESNETPETVDTLQPAKDIVKSSETHHPFKSPFKSHQSLNSKSKEAKSKSSRDTRSDSRENLSNKYSKHKASSDSSKGRSSRESSRGSSKDRACYSSKDRPRHRSHDKDHRSKHHHRDRRSSRDSKHSSKSRQSSKSRDSEKTHSNSNRYISHESKEEKYKDYDRRKDSKDRKSSNTGKCDKKSYVTIQKTIYNEKEADKLTDTANQEQKHNINMNKSSSAAFSSTSHGASKDRKSTNKNQDSTKSGHESKKSEKPKVLAEPNESVKAKTTYNPILTKSEKVLNSIEQQITAQKTSPQNIHKDKVRSTTNNETEKNVLQSPGIYSNTPPKGSEAEVQIDTSNEKKKNHKSDSSHKIETNLKQFDGSNKTSSSCENKDATKLSSEKVQKLKTLIKPDEVKSTTIYCRNPMEVVKFKSSKELDPNSTKSHNFTQEENTNTDVSIKNTEVIKYKKPEDSKGEKSANQKFKHNQTKDCKIPSEKTASVDKYVDSDKRQNIVVLEQDEPKKISEKEDLTDKSHIKLQTADKPDTKTETSRSVKESHYKTEKKESTKSTTFLVKVQNKNAEKTPQTNQGHDAQELSTVAPKNVPIKTKNPVSKIKAEPKTLVKIQNTSRESKIINIVQNSCDKKDTKEHDNYLTTKSNDDVKYKVKEKSTENMIGKTETSNLSELPATKIENQDENSVSKKIEKNDDSSTPSSKTKRLMETVLKKSVVILIEPLQSIHQQYLVKSNGDDIEIEPIKTRSYNENIKENDSIADEDHSKETSCEKLDATKLKRGNVSRSSSADGKTKSEKNASDEKIKQMVVVNDDIKSSEINAQATIEEKSKNKVASKKARQKADINQSDINFPDSMEITDEKSKKGESVKARQKSNKNQTVIKFSDNQETTNTQNTENQEKEATNLKSKVKAKGGRDQQSEPIKIINATNKSARENNKSVSEEDQNSCGKNNFEQIKTRQKVDLKMETVGKGVSERESKDMYACDDGISKRIQTRNKPSLTSEPPNITKALTIDKSNADNKTEKLNLADIKMECGNQETPVQKTDLKTESDQCQKLEAIEYKESSIIATKTTQKTDIKTAAKDKETMDAESEMIVHNFEQNNVSLNKNSDKSQRSGVCNEITENKRENFEPIKTREKADFKTEHKNSKSESAAKKGVLISKPGYDKTFTGKPENRELNFKSIKTRQKTDLTMQLQNSEVAESNIKFECEENNSESFKTNFKEEAKLSEICDKNPEQEENSPILTRQKADLKTETKKSDVDNTKEYPGEISEGVKNIIKPLKGRKSSDKKAEEVKNCKIGQNTATDNTCKVHITTETEKSSEDKQAPEIEEVKFEPIRTRSQIGQKFDLESGKSKISLGKISIAENSARSEDKDSRKTQRKIVNSDSDKSVDRKGINYKMEEVIEQSEGDIYSVKLVKEMEPEESVKEPLKTKRVNLKEEKSDNENAEMKLTNETNLSHKDLERIRSRKRDDIKVRNDKVKAELTQAKVSDDENNEVEKEHGEMIKTRRRVDLKEGGYKQTKDGIQQKKELQKVLEDDTSKDSKVESVKEKNETFVDERAANKTRKAGNLKEVMKENAEKSKLEQIKTPCDDFKAENKKESDNEKSSGCFANECKDRNEMCNNELSEEKNTIREAEWPHLKPRITRSRTELGVESATDNKNMTDKNGEPTSTRKETKRTPKEDVQTQKKPTESVKTRRGGNELNQTETIQFAENKIYTSQNDKITSTADEKETETLSSQAPTDEATQQVEIAEKSLSLEINSEIGKILQENSENELSRFESSSPSSNTDNSIRRTLRKRGTDTPFPENDITKKQFKESAQKTFAHLTSKSTKTDSSKRILRPPALEIDIQSPSKKPKLEPTKKSNDTLKEGLTPAPPKTSVITKEQVIEKRKLNESVAIVRKTIQNEITKEVKDNPKNRTLLVKMTEEKAHSVNVLPKQTLGNESTQKFASKDNSSKGKADSGNEAVLSKISKSKLKTTPGSTSVLSFSDWLKTKSQNISSESMIAKEDIPDTSKRQSRAQAKITPKSKEDKRSPEVSQVLLPEETNMILLQDTENVSASEGEHSVLVKPESFIGNANMDVTQQLGNGLLRSFENQVVSKEQNYVPKSNKKVKVKRLQTSTSDPKKPSPSRSKKNEIALLIESMSKEMKDGGITDLLNTEIHVKRQRIPNTKNLGVNALSATTPAKETKTLAAVVQLPNVQHDNEKPNAMNVSENLQYINKSPTRRKVQQNSGKSRRSTPLLHTDSFSRDIINTPDVTSPTKQVVVSEDPKIRKSLNIKDLPRHNEDASNTSTTADAVKTKKAMPLSLDKNANLSSRKTLTNSKQQQPQQPQVSKIQAFQIPKPTGPSIVLNKATTQNAEKAKLADRRSKVHQTDQFLLKKFKCRKLAVRVDRTIVQNFLNATNNQGQQTLTGKKRMARSTDTLKIMQNNSETNLRIQSVVDAGTLFNASSSSSDITEAQAAPTQLISSTINLQDSRVTPVSISAQPSYILPSSETSLTVPILNESFEFKNEFLDENPTGSINEAILPDTPTLLARAQTITEAAQQALSNSATPTDIRLLTANSSENHFVPSFGMTPTALDNRGTCMYTFLHPAKYNRNHSNVLLDYCCPNLDGPMPAIDPTRIHAQVQVPVIELPASIVLTTKVVTRADLESDDTSIPAIIRKKAEKIRKNLATHHKMAVSTVNTVPSTVSPSPLGPAPTLRPALPPTINALTKQLPATTTITPRIRPLLLQPTQVMVDQSSPPSSVAPTVSKNAIVSVIPKANIVQLNAGQQSSLRSNLRRFDVLLKQLAEPYESLSFMERHRVIEAIISSGKCLPKDLEQTLVLMEEYIKHTMLLRAETAPPTPAMMSTSNYITSQPAVVNLLPATQMPQLQPSPKILASKATPAATTATSYSNQFEQLRNKSVRNVQPRDQNITSGSSVPVTIKPRQVPIYDTDRNIIGYQMQVVNSMPTIPAYTKSTISAHTGAIMSTSPDTGYKATKRPLKRPAQDSPRVFYTTPPLKTSTPKVTTNSNIYPDQHAKNANTMTHKSQGSIVTTVRSAGSSSSGGSGTITTTTMATVKRVTRSTATGSKIIIVSKSDQSSEETILPDTDTNQEPTQQTEIKHEKDMDDFLG